MPVLIGLACILMVLPATAQLSPCVGGTQPGASLLLPWFEVDLDDPRGITTLVGVSNHADTATLVRATVWTDYGAPTFSFDLMLPARGAKSLDLRNLFAGRLPESPLLDAEAFPSCRDPLFQPALDPPALAQLRARHLGDPDPVDGLCYGSTRDGGPAVGFVTFDILTDCSEEIRFPKDPGYFELDGDLNAVQGLASFESLISGDVFYVDPANGRANGFALVSLVADREAFGLFPSASFYGSGYGDARAPLSSAWSTRYISGGALQATTDVLVWVAPHIFGVWPRECGLPADGSFLQVTARRESGESESGTNWLGPPVARLRVGDDLPVAAPFGRLELQGLYPCGICSPPTNFLVQTWITTLVHAEGGLSVGVQAVREDDLCR